MSGRVSLAERDEKPLEGLGLETSLEEVFPDRLMLHDLLALELGCKVRDELLVDQWVDVLAKLIEDEPIADLALVVDILDLLMRRETRARS